MPKIKLYDHVKRLLEKYPELRSSDKKLLWATWYSMKLVFEGVITKDDFYRAPSSESVTRARRKVQEDHPELASTPQVQARKDEKEATKGKFVYREEL